MSRVRRRGKGCLLIKCSASDLHVLLHGGKNEQGENKSQSSFRKLEPALGSAVDPYGREAATRTMKFSGAIRII